jgi:hypothetical protein
MTMMTDSSITELWRQLRQRSKAVFGWPREPTFSNEVDAAAALFGRQPGPEDSDLSAAPNSQSG